MIGKTVSHYRIISKLGRGGMSTVYLGEDIRLGRKVALKFLYSDFHDDSSVKERFLREAQAVASLQHPNIVAVYDIDEHDGSLYIAMEYVDGKSLREFISRHELHLQPTLFIGEQIAMALQKAHKVGVIHRDVKPDNVIINTDGVAKLLDFGLANMQGATMITQTGTTMGTPSYMSPEQIRGLSVNEQADIWSLGVIFYEMLTGHAPFRGDSSAELLYKIVNETPEPLTSSEKDIPRDVQKIISRALQKEPRKRYGSMDDFLRDLTNVKALEPDRRDKYRTITELAPERTQDETPIASPVTQKRPSAPKTGVFQQMRSLFRFGNRESGEQIPGGQPTPATPAPSPDGRKKGKAQTPIKDVPQTERRAPARPAHQPSARRNHEHTTLIRPSEAFDSKLNSKAETVRPEHDSEVTEVMQVHGQADDAELPPDEAVQETEVEFPSLIIKKPEFSKLTSHASSDIIEEIILYEDLERLESFIVHSSGGRLILTGYGRFGGTSLVKCAIRRARRELIQQGQNEGALLALYFKVIERSEGQRLFKIQANDISLGTLMTHSHTGTAKANPRSEEPLNEQSDLLTYDFSLSKPIGYSFLQRAGERARTTTPEIDFKDLIEEINQFAAGGKKTGGLKKSIFDLIGNETTPTRVIIILDRIRHLATLESLASLDLFSNEKTSVVAVTRKEDFDSWGQSDEHMADIGFQKWYVPCLWQSGGDYLARLKDTLLAPMGINDPNTEQLLGAYLKHLELSGKGILGEVIAELKRGEFWSKGPSGTPVLRLDNLPHKSNIRHNAWMQDVLSLNWNGIFGNYFAGKDMDEKEDKARIGTYRLINWMTNKQSFSKSQLLNAAKTDRIRISENDFILNEVAENLLHILTKLAYVKVLEDATYVLNWNIEHAPEPRSIAKRRRAKTPTTSTEQALNDGNNLRTETAGKHLKKPMIFYSYSHKDEKFRQDLETHLSLLKHQGVIEEWHDRCITAGSEWREQIMTHLNMADIILLLISPDFLSSKFCYEEEMTHALRRHKKGEATVVPVIVRPVDWDSSPFANLQALPKDAQPLTNWRNPDEAWVDIAKGIRRVAETL